ncbi:hypothetical protein VP01_1591g3 [Puccinia sorghi]|uniref:BSD domain-containing protein n=1 Tax=Puccinia sorghi TaxID=27349 RepID=A0A0L6VHJ1_9BASI|nr:hypothetical protein VP01_1591g3 [Puccinia sorghi]
MDIPSVHDHPHPKTTTTPETNTEQRPATTSGNSPAEETTHSATVSLDQELAHLKNTLGGVSASLGGWWGKVQKQASLAATNITAQINTARKDLAALNLIEKAKKEVERLGDHAKEGYAVISSEIEKGPDRGSTEGRIVNVDGVELPAPSRTISSSSSSSTTTTTAFKDQKGNHTSPEGKERAPNQNQPSNKTSSPNPLVAFEPTSIGSFLTKLTKDSESFTATLQSKISQLPHPTQVPARPTSSGKFDLIEVQKLAEGYLAKSEVYLQDVGKELKEFVKDAVKVIPPSELEAGDPSENPVNTSAPSGAVSVTEKRRMLDLKREAMLFKLRRDESELLADPHQQDEILRIAFDEFIVGVQQAGGLEGEAWKKRVQAELESEDSDQSALRALVEKLVPSSMTEETFWTRYFFRIHRIHQEEAARRVVLNAAQDDNEGDFSWDLEDESEPPSPAVMIKSGKETGMLVEEEEVEIEEQVGTPRIFSTAKNVEQVVPAEEASSVPDAIRLESVSQQPASHGATKSSSSGNHDTRANSASEPDTNDSFDVVSAQQSADEKPKKPTVVSSHSHKNDDDDDSDWE